jgi:hypothetical protein
MRFVLAAFLTLSIIGCENSPLPAVVGTRSSRDNSVRYANVMAPTPPVCENQDEEHFDPHVRKTCIWYCKDFWTPLRGAGRYDVARTWVWDEANQLYEPSSLNPYVGTNTYPFWDGACDDLQLTDSHPD